MHLLQGRAQASYIKDLYQQKFYSGNPANNHNLLAKVVSFQKKLEESKINRNYSQRIEQTPSFLAQEETNRFRPVTNYSHSRRKKERYSGRQSSREVQGPATAELKLILDRNHHADMNILTESIRQRNLYSKNQTRKRWKFISNRQTMNSNQFQRPSGKITPIDIGHFYQERELNRTSREKTNIMLKQRPKQENEEQSVRSVKTASKRVFIGGRDLSKAAEEDYNHYLQAKINLEQLVQQQKKKDQGTPRNIKQHVFQRKRIRRISPKKGENQQNHKNNKGSKTQPKNKQEDLGFNYQLDPWSVEPDIC